MRHEHRARPAAFVKSPVLSPHQDQAGGKDSSELVVNLDEYAGPLHLLLELARAGEVDLRRVSVLELANQYLAFLARAPTSMLQIAADYLIMACWLIYLKSRLLLPEPPVEEADPAIAADLLRRRLRHLQAIREAGASLMARPQLARDFYARPAMVEHATPAKERPTLPRPEVGLYGLMAGYAAMLQRRAPKPALVISPTRLDSMEDALRRLAGLDWLAGGSWTEIVALLPGSYAGSRHERSMLAATLTACLELARQGRMALRQDRAFGPLWITRHEGDGYEEGIAKV